MLIDYRNIKHDLVSLNNQSVKNLYLLIDYLGFTGKIQKTLAQSSMAATWLGSREAFRVAL